MATPIQNLIMQRGDAISLNLTVTNSSDGSAFNLTNASLRMTAKRDAADADNVAVFSLTIGTGITVTNAPGGLATIALVPANTSGLGPHRVDLLYDIQVTPSGNTSPITIVTGILSVMPDVSITFP